MIKLKIFWLISVLLLLTPVVSATTINGKSIDIQLGDVSNVTVKIDYRKITTNKITYETSYPAFGLRAKGAGKNIRCSVNQNQIGTEFKCMALNKTNYTLTLDYKAKELFNRYKDYYKFSIREDIIHATDRFSLKVNLPSGMGILKEEKNVSAINPNYGEVGGTGRKNFVIWDKENVKLGESLFFSLYFEKLYDPGSNGDNGGLFPELSMSLLIIIGAIGLSMFSFGYIYFGKIKNEGKEISALTKDEENALKTIIDSDGKIKQKELVSNLDYSKAKISKIVKELNNRNIISKKKKGRENVLQLEKEISENLVD